MSALNISIEPMSRNFIALKYRNLNQTGQDQPESSVLLSEVEQFQIIVLNPNELTQWPRCFC